MSGTIQHIGIVGACTMGVGIMINGVASGLDVTLIDRDPAVLDAARGKLAKYLARQVEKERIGVGAVPAILHRLSTSVDMSALTGADLVIEAVFENLELKRSIFGALENEVSDTTILASNTSCLRIADIAEALERPERFCGMHYFSPAEINPVVELIEGPATAPGVLATAADFLQITGKELIACKDQNGFALNRFFCPYTNEAVRILDEKCATAAQIDVVAKEIFGLALGPFAVMNIIGTATNLNAVRNLAPLGTFYEPAQSLVEHGEENRLWELDPDPAPLNAATARKISDRLAGAVLLPVTELLHEGTATLADVDRGARLAFRFNRPPGQLLKEFGEEGTRSLIEAVSGNRRGSRLT